MLENVTLDGIFNDSTSVALSGADDAASLSSSTSSSLPSSLSRECAFTWAVKLALALLATLIYLFAALSGTSSLLLVACFAGVGFARSLNGTSAIHGMVCTLWVFSSISVVALGVAYLARGPVSAEAICDVVVGTCSAALFALTVWCCVAKPRPKINPDGGSPLALHARPQRVRTRIKTAVRVVLFGAAFIFGVLSLYDSWAAIVNLSNTPPSSTFAAGPQNNSVHYWCEGTLKNSSIIIAEPGYMLPSHALYWIQTYLSNTTRTCVVEVSGMGQSQSQKDVGFASDAANMKAVLDAEFAMQKVPVQDRVAITAGHSRGHLSAATLCQNDGEHFKKCIVISLDGSRCSQGPQVDVMSRHFASTDVTRYAFVPFIRLFTGGMRLVWPLYRQFALTGGDYTASSSTVHKSDLPRDVARRFREVLLTSNYWIAAAGRSEAWAPGKYSGPTTTFCSQLRASDRHIIVDASSICTNTSICARHTSLLTSSQFAEIAVRSVIEPELIKLLLNDDDE